MTSEYVESIVGTQAEPGGPFAYDVTLRDRGGERRVTVRVSAAELLVYAEVQHAILSRAGWLFRHHEAEGMPPTVADRIWRGWVAMVLQETAQQQQQQQHPAASAVPAAATRKGVPVN